MIPVNEAANNPKIIHTDGKKRNKEYRVLLAGFMKKLSAIPENIDAPVLNLQEVSTERLLRERKKLVGLVKKGMLERKDLEEDIAIQAALVWFLRMKKEDQDRMTEAW